jgi:hypothetical protein
MVSGGAAQVLRATSTQRYAIELMRVTHQSRKSKSLRTSENVIAFLLAVIWSSGKSTMPGRNAFRGSVIHPLHPKRLASSAKGRRGWMTHQGDSLSGVLTVVQEVLDFPRVDARHAEHELSGDTECRRTLVLCQNGFCKVGQLGPCACASAPRVFTARVSTCQSHGNEWLRKRVMRAPSAHVV